MRTILSRRQFLGAVGASLGFASIGAINSLALSLETPSLGNLGFILTESKQHPDLAVELIEGMVQHLSHSYKIAQLEKTNQQSLQDFVQGKDTIVTYASPSHAYLFRKQLTEVSTPLMALDLGMDIQRFGENLPFLSYLSLNYWQLAQALALWAKEKFGERLLVVTDSYSSGYDSFNIFESSFPQAKIIFYPDDSITETLRREDFTAIAFALTSENVQCFIKEYEALANHIPLIRLPYIGDTIQSISPIYSASFAFNDTPFYTLGQRAAMLLQGQSCDEIHILINHNHHAVAQYMGSQLPYHGMNNRFKTGWTNAYPI